jgi:UPF0716 protein FxsA
MQIYLFLAFIAVPIIEIALFIKAGQLIGVLPTIVLTVVTAIAGSFLMRVQGFAVLNRFTEAAAKGEMPVNPVIDGLGILVAGLLLMTPGFFTDFLGLLLFIPLVRRAMIRWVFSRAAKSTVHVRTYGAGRRPGAPHEPRPEPPNPSGRPSRPGGPGFRKADNVIDAEFETIEPDKDGKDGERGTRAKKSPWRQD